MPFPSAQMAVYAISKRINNPKYDVPDCVAPSGRIRMMQQCANASVVELVRFSLQSFEP